MRRRVLVAVAAIAALMIAGFFLIRIPLIDVWVFRRMANYSLALPPPTLASDKELAVLLVGTGSPLPDKSRAGPCTLVAAGDRLFIVDAGFDSARNLMLWRVPLDRVTAILITHLHSDHIPELGELRLQTWVAGRKTHLPVYGPPGIEDVVDGFNMAYALDASYRTKHHGAAMLPPDAVALDPRVVVIGSGATAPVLDSAGLRITAIRVKHDPANPAYGYRFDFAGRSVVVSGDTSPDSDLAKAARDTDVLVHEALSPELVGILHEAMIANGRTGPAKIMHDIPGYHTSPIDAAKIANAAHARLLVLTHLIPMLPNALAERAFVRGVGAVRPDGVILGRDGMIFRLPPRSDAIEPAELD